MKKGIKIIICIFHLHLALLSLFVVFMNSEWHLLQWIVYFSMFRQFAMFFKSILSFIPEPEEIY